MPFLGKESEQGVSLSFSANAYSTAVTPPVESSTSPPSLSLTGSFPSSPAFATSFPVWMEDLTEGFEVCFDPSAVDSVPTWGLG